MNLKVENGCFFYRRGKPILQGIHFEVQSGDLLAVLGPNGCGKTTLLRCVTGLLRWKEGNTLLDGCPLLRLSDKERWRRIAYVPQAKGGIPPYSVLEMTLLGRTSRLNPFQSPGKKDVDACLAVLERLGLAALRDSLCSELSGGQLQMVLIARALAAEPNVLILDEPETNLDFKNQLIVLQTLSDISSNGITCIFNTHYPAHALQRANKALMLGADGSYLFGKTAEVITEQNIHAYFGVNAHIQTIKTPEYEIQNVIAVSVAEN